MDENELNELTRKTSERLLGPQKKGEGTYALWREFDPELAKHFSRFFVGRLYAREVLSQKQRELCAVGALTVRISGKNSYPLSRRAECRCDRSGSRKVIFQMSTYGGAPCMHEGLKS